MSIDSDILSTGADSSGIDFVVQSQNGIRKLRMRFWRGRRVEGTWTKLQVCSAAWDCIHLVLLGNTTSSTCVLRIHRAESGIDEYTGTSVMTVVETGSVYQN
ncbi:uncharacterized protein N7484_008835 [Penicillium longicatenatum]|uniref:uncharacterized protein n=1 Tax=Penicillium longicatenatum TaxID=1561947 RepID=UPI002547A67A|nr:uncharacterized protein N7484_008835 [Penicillium longicatenatum]KAJ5635522.1 hypothetical protein N7484_008835 [Penicillium longicatenatum]